MEELRFSVDEQKYNDRHGHVLSLEGWYIPVSGKVCRFELVADGHEKIEIPAVVFRTRPDVEQALQTELGDLLSYIIFSNRYSTDFSDSTMSIFFSFLCINTFITTEKIQVITAQYTKLSGAMFLPNMTASTSTVTMIKR